jgi:hypothetical protein
MAFVQFQHRHDTMANWNLFNPILAPGETGLEIDTSLFKIGNGINNWKSLQYGGTKGSTGSIGATGSVGYISNGTQSGSTGRTGSTGPSGPLSTVAGPFGPTGSLGNVGLTGYVSTVAGPQGPTGTQGPVGIVGPAGSVGTLGPAGTLGTAGEVGPEGPQGPQGPQGAVGPVGPAGPSTTSLVTWGEMPIDWNTAVIEYDMSSQPDGIFMGFLAPKVITTDEGMYDNCLMCVLVKNNGLMEGLASRRSNGTVPNFNSSTFSFYNNEAKIIGSPGSGSSMVRFEMRNTHNTQGGTYVIIRIS